MRKPSLKCPFLLEVESFWGVPPACRPHRPPSAGPPVALMALSTGSSINVQGDPWVSTQPGRLQGRKG